MTLKVILRNGFGQDISNLVFRPDGIDFDKTIANVLPKVMETRVDMLGAWTEFGKTGKFEGTGVVLECFAIYMQTVAKGDVIRLCEHTRKLNAELEASGEKSLDLVANVLAALENRIHRKSD